MARKRVSGDTPSNRQAMYASIIEAIFRAKYRPGAREVDFERGDLVAFGETLGVELPKNPGDLVYSFRYRRDLPASITSTADRGKAWIIRLAGRGRYKFVLVPDRPIAPNSSLVTTKIPDATPGVIGKYALSDEQALLARVRYNRLVDIFTGVACYSLQSHLRTTVSTLGQVETDELYVGIDKRGAHYVFPIQAKGGKDRLSVVQVEQDMALCADKFGALICRPIGAQFMSEDIIVLFEFEESDDGIRIASEKHYRLVPPAKVSAKDLERYKRRVED